MLTFLQSVGGALPCATCRRHYDAYASASLDERAVRDRDALTAWVAALHNDVNRRTGKPEWSVEEVRRRYMIGSAEHREHASRSRRVATGAWIATVAAVLVAGVFLVGHVGRLPN